MNKKQARKGVRKLLVGLIVTIGFLMVVGWSPGQLGVLAQDTKLVQVSPYFARGTATVEGVTIGKVTIGGPPEPPTGFFRMTEDSVEPHLEIGINILSNVPAFNWSFGCSATSAAMIAGYYDRTAFPNMYTGPTNGGIMPIDNNTWPDWHDGTAWRHQCPLSATHSGLDGRAANGHVDDYWVSYGDPGPDPFDGNWPEHTYSDCTADFMKTNQAAYGNTDGATAFWLDPNGTKYTGTDVDDGGYGLQLFYESRGYSVVDRYNRVILGYDWDGSGSSFSPATQGATFEDYKAEIDAGRPVMIHLEGHTIVGVGYDDSTNTVYIHDTWDYSTHTMTWGGTYSGMKQLGVTIVTLAEPEVDVCGLGNSIPDGDVIPDVADGTDFAVVAIGESSLHTFSIYNDGQELLELTGSPTVQVSGTDASDFTVTDQPGITSLAPGESTIFTVEFNPSTTGLKIATITIGNTDLNESVYDFAVQGTGNDPSDVAAPTPDPLTWYIAPNVTVSATISMIATTASDPSGVEYYFEETTGNPGGNDSEWQDSATYSDDGLQAYTQYCYRVKARDKWANQSETGWSSVDCATLGPPETAAVFRIDSEGRVFADSAMYGESFQTGAADIAEWVPISEPVDPGDVLEFDPDNPGHYRKCRGPCSDLVAGVVSTEPGFVLGSSPSTLDLGHWTSDSGLWTDDSRLATGDSVLLALVGIVPAKVTDEGGPIQPGDLLVTSSTPGYAMRWDPGDGSSGGLVGEGFRGLGEWYCGNPGVADEVSMHAFKLAVNNQSAVCHILTFML